MQAMKKQKEEDFVAQEKFTCYEDCISCFGRIAGCCGMWLPFPCCCCPKPFVTIPSSCKGILEKFGGFQGVLEPGLHNVNPACEKVQVVDLKTRVNILLEFQIGIIRLIRLIIFQMRWLTLNFIKKYGC